MPTPPKPFKLLESEGKSHRTKAELRQRKEAEAATITGEKMREAKSVKDNKIAHDYFKRTSKLLEKIEKNDAIYENIVNRYCELNAEIEELQKRKETMEQGVEEMYKLFKEFVVDSNLDSREKADYLDQFTKNMVSLEKSIGQIDGKINTKRTAIFNIEKECYLTPAAAIRSIPKKEKEDENPLKKILSG